MIKNEKFIGISDTQLRTIRGAGFITASYEYLFSNAGDIVKKMGQRSSYYDHLYKDFK